MRSALAGSHVPQAVARRGVAIVALLGDRPPVLFVKGRLNREGRAVAIIGTGKPTDWGRDTSRSTARDAVARGWTVVSGLAMGIDTEAHMATLDSGGRTIAIVGSGLDRVAPNQNRSLADRIVAQGGTVVSEQPFGVPATKASLVQRNRITSGLCSIIVLIESGLTGGSMQTVRFALQGRRVFASVSDDTAQRTR
jgi:DNA processing protein